MKTKQLTIAVDFDGTLCNYNFPNIGDQTSSQKKLVKFLIQLKKDGHKLILYTCRGDNEKYPALKEAIEWCHDQGLTFDAINENIPNTIKKSGPSPKPIADIYLDDKAINFNDWETWSHANFSKYHTLKTASVVIPARFQSSRFEGKPLATILGIPMIIRVADIAAKAVGKENVYIATDSEKISRVIETHGYNFIMTSSSCLTGTDRVSEAAKKIDSDIIINIQGDEPMLDPNDIISVIEEKKKYPNSVITCMANLSANEDPNDKKIPKIITDINNKLLYASRTAIPGSKNGTAPEFKKQVCIYGFTHTELETFTSRDTKTPLEKEEDIEIIRFLELGTPVQLITVDAGTHAVDYKEDIAIVEKLLNTNL